MSRASTLVSILILVVGAGQLLAAPPSRPSQARYTRLHTDSPFTSKPISQGPVEAPNPMEDFALGGVSRLNDGYFVILFNKKKAGEKVVLRPGAKDNVFQVEEVKWSDKNWKETEVVLRTGSRTGSVTFEEALLKVNPATPAAKPGQQKQAAPNQRGNNDRQNNNNRRRPRPRVVTPPSQ